MPDFGIIAGMIFLTFIYFITFLSITLISKGRSRLQIPANTRLNPNITTEEFDQTQKINTKWGQQYDVE